MKVLIAGLLYKMQKISLNLAELFSTLTIAASLAEIG